MGKEVRGKRTGKEVRGKRTGKEVRGKKDSSDQCIHGQIDKQIDRWTTIILREDIEEESHLGSFFIIYSLAIKKKP